MERGKLENGGFRLWKRGDARSDAVLRVVLDKFPRSLLSQLRKRKKRKTVIRIGSTGCKHKKAYSLRGAVRVYSPVPVVLNSQRRRGKSQETRGLTRRFDLDSLLFDFLEAEGVPVLLRERVHGRLGVQDRCEVISSHQPISRLLPLVKTNAGQPL